MNIGTKSLLYGVHQFALHPVCVLLAWRRLYGRLPRDPRMWLAILVHDWGYWGSPNMDGPEGEAHVDLGARIMSVFGAEWRDLCLYHSRFRAAQDGREPSKLCAADKLAILIMPQPIYMALGTMTGEIREYMARCGDKYAEEMGGPQTCPHCWYRRMSTRILRWIGQQRRTA